jgi:hypothetical protein
MPGTRAIWEEISPLIRCSMGSRSPSSVARLVRLE